MSNTVAETPTPFEEQPFALNKTESWFFVAAVVLTVILMAVFYRLFKSLKD